MSNTTLSHEDFGPRKVVIVPVGYTGTADDIVAYAKQHGAQWENVSDREAFGVRFEGYEVGHYTKTGLMVLLHTDKNTAAS